MDVYLIPDSGQYLMLERKVLRLLEVVDGTSLAEVIGFFFSPENHLNTSFGD